MKIIIARISKFPLTPIAVHPLHQGNGLGLELIKRLILASKGHRKIILYAIPDKENFYRKFGFRRMKTAMAIFENVEQAAVDGLTD